VCVCKKVFNTTSLLRIITNVVAVSKNQFIFISAVVVVIIQLTTIVLRVLAFRDNRSENKDFFLIGIFDFSFTFAIGKNYIKKVFTSSN